jgi:hypothetical protein
MEVKHITIAQRQQGLKLNKLMTVHYSRCDRKYYFKVDWKMSKKHNVQSNH